MSAKGGATVPVTDNNFKAEVLESKTPVLVDFWAEWCGPCKALAPRIEELASQYSGKIKVVSVDVDANPDTPSTFGIRSIPTLLTFKGGKMVGELVGAHPTKTIEDLIQKAIT
jgi:thioredoxin 1